MYVTYLYAKKGDWARSNAAFQRLRESAAPFRYDDFSFHRIMYLAEIDVARVERDLDALRGLNDVQRSIARSWVEMAHGRYARAVEAADHVPPNTDFFYTNFTKGVAYLRAGRWRASIEKLEYCRDMVHVRKDSFPHWSIPVHYYLGQAYEAGGETAKAIHEYEKFIDWWRDADSLYIDQVNDARLRLKRLRA